MFRQIHSVFKSFSSLQKEEEPLSIKKINDNFLDAAASLSRLSGRLNNLDQQLSALDAASVAGWTPGAFGIWSLGSEFTLASSGFYQIPYDKTLSAAPFGLLQSNGTVLVSQSGTYDIRVVLRLSYSGRSDLRIQNTLVGVNYSTDTGKTASIHCDSINQIDAGSLLSVTINFPSGGSVITSASRLLVYRLS